MSGIAYSRPPRSYPEPLPEEPFEIAPPPAVVPGAAGGGILLYLLPALASLASIGFIFTFPGAQRSQALVLLVGAIVLLSVLSGFLMWWLQRGSQRSRRRWERRRYLEYLGRVQSELDRLAARQAAQLREMHPDLAALEALARQHERVWERRRGDADFLHVSLGRGRVPLCRGVLVQAAQNNPLVEYDADLLQRAQALVAKYAHLDGVPVEVDLRELGWLGVEGEPAAATDVVRSLLLEACVLAGPDDLQVALVADTDRLADWAWLKWLPHCRRSRRARTGREQSAALIASEPAAVDALVHDLVRPRLGRVAAAGAGVAAQVMPHLLLVVDGPQAAAHLERLPDVERLATGAETGLTLLRLGPSSAAAAARIEVEGSGLLSYEEAGFGGRRVAAVRAGRAGTATAERIGRALAPLRLEEKETVRDLGDEIRLAELLGTASLAELDPARAWTGEPRHGLLRIPVGERLDGNSVVLDFKEAAEGGMGPHGLIVGATGSGKSELLRTVVCALAATHDPDLLSFVFVDFKGGASFADLARLPHSAGMITNLEGDLTLVDRMQSALFGEMERRQRLLREAGNVDNIRIYRARRELNPALPALPYLLVIVDEFGELLANRPDFLELFVTLGRVGRSLGIHLLLATQRLDEGRIRGLEGYLRYRICLRTFSPEESSAVLGSPAAYQLPPYPGTAYLKVDGPLELFKVALVSTPSATPGASPILEFTAGGELRGLSTVTGRGEAAATDMAALVERLGSTGDGRHQVWLPPLPVRLTLGDVPADWRPDLRGGAPPEPPFGPLCVVVGETDLPRAQRREPLLLDFSGVGGHLAVVGAPQSGKSTLLRTLVTAFALTHSPEEVQFYVVDLGGGLLRSLQSFPHVGAVAGKADRERLLQVVHHAAAVIDEREALFREHGLDGMAAYRRLRAAGRLPEARYGDVFLVVDDAGQAQAEVEQVEPELVRIATTGLSYGVHLLVTGNRWADLRPKLRDAIGSRLELRLNDPAESELGRQAAATLPPGIPGRGLTRQALHFQAALPLVGGVELEGVAEWARQAWPATAPPVLALPSLVAASELPPGAVAVEQTRLSPLAFDLEASDPHFLVFGDAESGKTNLLRTWIRSLASSRPPAQAAIHVVDYRRTLTDIARLPHVRLAVTPDDVTALAGELLAELGSRQPPGLGERWSGRHEYLFVDDYDWVASAVGNPLAPLADLLLQGRDIGLHVVLARRVGGTARSSYEPFFQRLRESSPVGLILDGDPLEGPLVGAARAQPLPPGRGLLVRRGHQPLPVQVAFSPVRPGVVRASEKEAGGPGA